MDKVVLIHRMKRGYEMKDTDKKVNKKSNLDIYNICGHDPGKSAGRFPGGKACRGE